MKLIVFGGGDLAQRVLALLSCTPAVREVLVVTGAGGEAAALARLYGGCLSARVRGAVADWNDPASVKDLLARERPGIVLHASAFVSPWLALDRPTDASRRLGEAGFGVMLPAQLMKIRTVMRAVRELGLTCPVVNASYPDLTNAVLATEDLAPTIGVGNAGMIFRRVLDALQEQGSASVPRLLAHHSQVTRFVRGWDCAPGETPMLFLDDERTSIADLVSGALPEGRLLNALTAAHAVEVLAALLGREDELRTSAPGPLGLQGGWPVRISHRGVHLDLPAGVSTGDALAYQRRAATFDGIAGVDADGTVHFTEATRAAIAPLAPDLAQPLRPSELESRLVRLMDVVFG